MAERKSLDGLTLSRVGGVTTLALEAMEIWDGADLALLRDGLNFVIVQEKCRSIAVDMSAVKYVPSGFFGMLFDWFERGVAIRLIGPQERVRNMIWFRQFFDAEADAWYVLHDRPATADSAGEMDAWREENEWDGTVTETVSADR